MTLKLTRQTLFLTGVAILFIYLCISRVNFLLGSAKVTGQSTGGHSHQIKYTVGPDTYIIFTESNARYRVGQKVPVLYKRSDPQNACVYSLLDFWLPPLIWGLVPLMLFSAAIFSFMYPDDIVIMKFGKEKTSDSKGMVLLRKNDSDHERRRWV